MRDSFDASLIDVASKDAFWEVVEDCLVKIHRVASPQAKLSAFRVKLNATGGGAEEVIYHDEPFYVACDIAGLHEVAKQEHLLAKNEPLYASILNAHDW